MFRRYGTATLRRAQARFFSKSLAPITVFMDAEKEEVTAADLRGVWTQLTTRGTVRETRLYCTEDRASSSNMKALRDVTFISPGQSEKVSVNLTLALDLMAKAFESTEQGLDQVFAIVLSDPELLEVADSVCVRYREDLPRLRLLILAPNHACWLRHEAWSLCDEFIEYDPLNPDWVSAVEVPGKPTEDTGSLLALKVLSSLGYLGEDLVSGVDFFEKKNMDRLPEWYKKRAVGKTPLARIAMLSSVFSDACVLNMWQRSIDPEQLRFKLAKYSLLDSPACTDAELQVALIKILVDWKRTPPSTSLAENMRAVMYHFDELRVARSRRYREEVS